MHLLVCLPSGQCYGTILSHPEQDIDYMNNHLDFTYDPKSFAGLPAFVDDLHSHHQHYVMIVDPGISNTQAKGTYPPYDGGLQQGIHSLCPW